MAHDQLWNLLPINASVNSSKSNKLPDLDLYFSQFAHQHYSAFKIAFGKERRSWLEDYVLLFGRSAECIDYMQEEQFADLLLGVISPLEQIAGNAGFGGGWAWEERA